MQMVLKIQIPGANVIQGGVVVFFLFQTIQSTPRPCNAVEWAGKKVQSPSPVIGGTPLSKCL